MMVVVVTIVMVQAPFCIGKCDHNSNSHFYDRIVIFVFERQDCNISD